MTWPGIEPWSPGPLANTLPTRNTIKSKVIAARLEEKLFKWKEHFKILVGNPSEIPDKPTKNLIIAN